MCIHICDMRARIQRMRCYARTTPWLKYSCLYPGRVAMARLENTLNELADFDTLLHQQPAALQAPTTPNDVDNAKVEHIAPSTKFPIPKWQPPVVMMATGIEGSKRKLFDHWIAYVKETQETRFEFEVSSNEQWAKKLNHFLWVRSIFMVREDRLKDGTKMEELNDKIMMCGLLNGQLCDCEQGAWIWHTPDARLHT